MRKLFIISLASLSLAGCVNARTSYTSAANPNYHAFCRAVGFGVIGSLVSYGAYQECKKEMMSKGFIEAKN